jgi:hypothetical protein
LGSMRWSSSGNAMGFGKILAANGIQMLGYWRPILIVAGDKRKGATVADFRDEAKKSRAPTNLTWKRCKEARSWRTTWASMRWPLC